MPHGSAPDPNAGDPLPGELEDACTRAAQTDEDVLLVGSDRSLLERVARRIHHLGNAPSPLYRAVSCRTIPSDFVRAKTVRRTRMVGVPALLIREMERFESSFRHVEEDVLVPSEMDVCLSTYDTVHLADVESAGDIVLWAIRDLMEHRDAVNGLPARVVASTTADPGQWPYVPLLEDMRRWRRIVVGEAPAGTPAEEGAEETKAENVFRRTANCWEVTYAGRREHFADSGGMRAIAYLLSLPDGTPADGAAEVRAAMDGGDPQAEALRQAQSTGEDVTDQQTVAQVRERQRDVREELEAEDLDLPVKRRAELEEERDKIDAYLSGAVGIDGRPRTVGGRRDGQAVGKAIARALAQIEKVHPGLSGHLDASVEDHYGDAIRYAPPAATTWVVTM